MKLTKLLTQQLTRIGLAAVLLSTLNLQLSTAHAQGTAFAYQGVLNDGGAPATGLYDLEFRAFDAVSGGAQQGGVVTANDMPVTNGLFTTTLDFGAAVFTGPARWLNIAVRPGASVGSYANLLPRQPIAASPYAVFAGGSAAAGVTGTLPDARLSANVALRAGGNAFTGQQTVMSGNVGIGTTTPGENLSIVTTTSTPSEASATLSLSSFGGNTWILNSVSGFGGGHNNAPPGSLQFYNVNSDTSPLVLQAGAVGIGGPAVSLDKLTVSGQYLGVRSPDLADLIMVGNNGASRMDVALTAGAGQFSSSAALGDSVIRNIGGKVHLQSGSGASAVTIDTANRVGINTPSPQYELDVNGKVRAVGFICRPGIAFASGGNVFNVNWTGSAAQLWIDNVMVGLISLTSDRRLKEEVQPMTGSAIERVMALQPVTFKYKNIAGTAFTGSPITQEGFIADQVQQVVPSGVNGKNDAVTKEGQIQPQTLNPLPLISVLTKATQELARQMQAQESELTDLRAELSQLRSEKTSLTKLASEMEARFVRLEQAMHKTTVPAVKDVSASADVK